MFVYNEVCVHEKNAGDRNSCIRVRVCVCVLVNRCAYVSVWRGGGGWCVTAVDTVLLKSFNLRVCVVSYSTATH